MHNIKDVAMAGSSAFKVPNASIIHPSTKAPIGALPSIPRLNTDRMRALKSGGADS